MAAATALLDSAIARWAHALFKSATVESCHLSSGVSFVMCPIEWCCRSARPHLDLSSPPDTPLCRLTVIVRKYNHCRRKVTCIPAHFATTASMDIILTMTLGHVVVCVTVVGPFLQGAKGPARRHAPQLIPHLVTTQCRLQLRPPRATATVSTRAQRTIN